MLPSTRVAATFSQYIVALGSAEAIHWILSKTACQVDVSLFKFCGWQFKILLNHLLQKESGQRNLAKNAEKCDRSVRKSNQKMAKIKNVIKLFSRTSFRGTLINRGGFLWGESPCNTLMTSTCLYTISCRWPPKGLEVMRLRNWIGLLACILPLSPKDLEDFMSSVLLWQQQGFISGKG